MIERRKTVSASGKTGEHHFTTEKVVGYLGEVHPKWRILTESAMCLCGSDRYAAEILGNRHSTESMRESQKYPAVSRDISMVVPKEILVTDRRCDRSKRRKNIWRALRCSICMRAARRSKTDTNPLRTIVFRAKDRTLEEADVSRLWRRHKLWKRWRSN